MQLPQDLTFNFCSLSVSANNISIALAIIGGQSPCRNRGKGTAAYNEINYPVIQKHGQQVNTFV